LQMHGSSYQRKLAIVKGGPAPSLDVSINETISLVCGVCHIFYMAHLL
jgi:hypothetical protein